MGETMLKREAASAAFKGGGERQQRKDLLISNRRFIFALRKQKEKKTWAPGNTGKTLVSTAHFHSRIFFCLRKFFPRFFVLQNHGN